MRVEMDAVQESRTLPRCATGLHLDVRCGVRAPGDSEDSGIAVSDCADFFFDVAVVSRVHDATGAWAAIRPILGALARPGDCRIDQAAASILAGHGLASDGLRLIESGATASDDARLLLAGAAKRELMRSMTTASTATAVSALLEAAGIPALVYKGPPLAAQTTGDWRGRGSADVDVLVDVGSLARVHAALSAGDLHRADGYSVEPNSLTRWLECERSYTGLGCTVDLHWRIDSTPGYCRLAFVTLWARRARVEIGSGAVSTLDPLDAVVVTAAHGTREQWRSLRWAVDACRQLSGMPPREWTTTVERARAAGALKSLAVALAVAELGGGVELPARPGTWARAVAERFLIDACAATANGTQANRVRAARRRADRWRTADTPATAIDGLLRATGRQLVGDAHKSHLPLRGSRQIT